MEAPQKRIVRALIPTNETPTRFVVTKEGHMPFMEHTENSGHTFEGTLSQIGRKALNQSLSVAEAIQSTFKSDITYRTKVVSPEVPLNHGYKLSPTEPE